MLNPEKQNRSICLSIIRHVDRRQPTLTTKSLERRDQEFAIIFSQLFFFLCVSARINAGDLNRTKKPKQTTAMRKLFVQHG